MISHYLSENMAQDEATVTRKKVHHMYMHHVAQDEWYEARRDNTTRLISRYIAQH